MAVKLFDDHTPDCACCAHMRSGENGAMCQRRRAPAVRACGSFSYDPLKRVPRQEPRLPVYRPEDFSLDTEADAGDEEWQ